jgi:hypothetical protein
MYLKVWFEKPTIQLAIRNKNPTERKIFSISNVVYASSLF